MTKKSKITAEQIETSLSEFCQKLSQSPVKLDTVPPGWFTVAALAVELGKASITISERMRRMVKDGEVERKNFVIQLEQRIRPVPHYRLLKK